MSHPLTVQPGRIEASGHRVAVVIGATKRLERKALVALVTTLTGSASAVALAATESDAGKAIAMAAKGIPSVTGRAVTDAVKRMEGSAAVASVDKARLATVDLPVVLTLGAIADRLGSSDATWIDVGDFCAPGQRVTVVAAE